MRRHLEGALKRTRGFALIMALFLIVTLAALGVYLLTVSNVQVETGVMDEQGARAQQAARAGLEWGAYQVLHNSSCVTGLTALTLAGNLAGFRAEVVCTAYAPESEAGISVSTYRITATGCNASPCTTSALPPALPPDQTYVERQLQLTIAK
jgi:MSHA biogenesis protein MshP